MREKILLMGSPGTGKSTQVYLISKFLADLGKRLEVIDCEDKFESLCISEEGSVPKNITLQVATEWPEILEATEHIMSRVKSDDWIAVDRADLAWPAVQRHYTLIKYKQSLGAKLIASAIDIKKRAMFIPRFDQGDWQPVNESYDGDFMHQLLFKSRCNIVLTTGIKGVDEGSPLDIFGNLGVLPRGQKEIGHQPNSVFLLHQKKEKSNQPPHEMVTSWHIVTAKDLKSRRRFEGEELFDFSLQYLTNYYSK